MLKIVALGGCILMVLALNYPASQAGAMRKSTTEDQVAVLLKWYHDYSEKGKHEQACRVAELAPEDPETLVAFKLARRQENTKVQVQRKSLREGSRRLASTTAYWKTNLPVGVIGRRRGGSRRTPSPFVYFS